MQDHINMVKENVFVRYFTDNIDGRERYRQYLQEIFLYNPAFIIDITNENCIITLY